MKKLLIVHSTLSSSWESCKTISSNLGKAYQLLDSQYDITWFPIPESVSFLGADDYENIETIFRLKEAIRKLRPERLVFIDHSPHPSLLLQGLRKTEPTFVLPPILIHVYGDFTYYSGYWHKLAVALRSHPLQLVCASAKQTRLVQGFLKQENSGSLETLFFPVDRKQFQFDSEARLRTRAAWGVSADESILLYTGRMSLQKNTIRLLKEFTLLSESSSSKPHLFLAGTFDDVGAHLMGIKTATGYYFNRVQECLAKIPPKIRERIHFLGHLGGKALSDAYSASDAFVSLSLYHDEDFGMSVAEALACGLPCVISDWGGFSSFAKTGLPCQLIPVEGSKSGILLSSSICQEKLRAVLDRREKLSPQERQATSKTFYQSFSVETAARLIQGFLEKPPQPFPGFNWKLEHLSSLVCKDKPNPAFLPGKGNFYWDIYRPYFTEDRRSP